MPSIESPAIILCTAIIGILGRKMSIELECDKPVSVVVEKEKIRGNNLVQEGKYAEALNIYEASISSLCRFEALPIPQGLVSRYPNSEFITDKPIHEEKIMQNILPALLSNAALCSIKMENYGDAVILSTFALEVSHNTFVKAYFRRGTAYVLLNKVKLACNDFKRLLAIVPNDKDAEVRLKEAQKLLTQQKFAAAIAAENPAKPSESIDMTLYEIPPTYKGPLYTIPTPELFLQFSQYLENHCQRLDKGVILRLLLDVIATNKKLPNVVPITVQANQRIVVCGDVHGQFYDLLNIFKTNGLPSAENIYLFNGDFVDRGSFSLEVICLLYLARMIWPTSFYMTRGNHETRDMTKMYGFEGEVRAKATPTLYDLFIESFDYLPLCHTINDRVFVVHGGLSTDSSTTLAAINGIDRVNDKSTLMEDLLWADPQPMNGSAPSRRGVSHTFGPDITKNFLDINKLELVIRSHEMKDEGYQIEHGGLLVTIFSAPNYCDQMQNKGAVLIFEGKDLVDKGTPLKLKPVQFTAQPHPPVNALQYASKLVCG